MRCPSDGTALVSASYGGCPTHRCTACLGASVHGTLLRKVRARAALELHQAQDGAAGERHCPFDGRAMRALHYQGVDLCVCPQCLGLWLERGQLSRLLALTGPPDRADLAKLGQDLAAVPGGARPGPSTTLSDLGDMLTFVADVADAIGKIAD